MKKILIICDAFPPQFAPRMGYLCKYLPLLGWEPVIITEFHPHSFYKELAINNNVTYINYYHSGNKILRKLKYTFVFLADFFFNYKNIRIVKAGQQQINNHNISIILSSTHRTFPLKAASILSSRNKLPLIIDLRDIFEQYPNNEHISKQFTKLSFLNNIISAILTKKQLKQRNEALKKADYITTVSPWHVSTLKQYNENVSLIYNGFDPELFYPKAIPSNQFKITYVGRIVSLALRDPSLLFESISELYNKKEVSLKDVRIQFYTDDKSKEMLNVLADRYGISMFIDYFDYVPNTGIPKILNDSSILLLLTNKSSETGPKGIMTTKFFEYLAIEKPILCIKNDESYLENMIHETQSGLSASTTKEVIDFITEKRTEWNQNKFTRQIINHSLVNQFSRKEQAKQFVAIFESLIK